MSVSILRFLGHKWDAKAHIGEPRGIEKLIQNRPQKSVSGGSGALLGSLGRYFGTKGSQSMDSGRILIAKGDARMVPKGGREMPREAQELPKSVFFVSFPSSMLRSCFSSFFKRFFIDCGVVFGDEN